MQPRSALGCKQRYFNMAGNSSDNNGCECGCLFILAIGFIALCVNICSGNDKKKTETPTKHQTTNTYSDPQKSNESVYNSEDELSEEDKKYLNNSLSTGSTPYESFYGKNYKCPYSQCSGVRVTAPRESDIVVIIKRNNSDGKVIAHGYIKAGGTYQFDVPDGTYQTFFYYGEGWNPNKEMGNGVKGGFVKNELFSKDNPQEIYSAVLSYVLQLQTNGNFQTKGSNKSECF